MWKRSSPESVKTLPQSRALTRWEEMLVKHNRGSRAETGKPRNVMMAVHGLLRTADGLIKRTPHFGQVSPHFPQKGLLGAFPCMNSLTARACRRVWPYTDESECSMLHGTSWNITALSSLPSLNGTCADLPGEIRRLNLSLLAPQISSVTMAMSFCEDGASLLCCHFVFTLFLLIHH